MIDREDREWNEKFGESYLDCDPDEDHLDDEQIDQLEEAFLEDESNPTAKRSAYGNLDELPDDPGESKR